MDDDWSGRWRIGRRRLDDERKTWQCVHWNAVVRPVRVVILVDDSLTHTLLASHQAAVPLSTAYNTRVIALQMVSPRNEGHSRAAEMVSLRTMDLSYYQCYRSLGLVMVALCNRADHYIFILWFVLSSSSSSSFFFPRLISVAADWMSAILPHMVWP